MDDVLTAIARVRRSMPRNVDVMRLEADRARNCTPRHDTVT